MRGLVRDAFFPIRAVIVGAFVPVARAVPAPVAIAVLVRGRRDGALVAANIAGRICVIVIDAVSYTHLDVYKRQCLSSGSRL